MDFDFLRDRAGRARRMIPALEEYIRKHYVEERKVGAAPPASGAGMPGEMPMAAASMNAAMPVMSREEAAPEKREARPAKYMAKPAQEPKKEEKKARGFDFFGNALGGVASKRRFAKESAPEPLVEARTEKPGEAAKPAEPKLESLQYDDLKYAKEEILEPEPLYAEAECDYSVCAKEDEWDFEAHESALKERMTHLSDTYQQYLFYLIQSKGMSNAEVYKRAIVDKKTFAKIKANEHYHPAKLTALQLCVGAKLNLDETRDLLARAGYALSPCDKTDVIFSYFIENGIYDMIEIDIQLEEHGEHCIVV
ncbi:MAG: hypothetical protein IKH28_07815 [Lachnospiraceae bacterium]|nr:hypothetical protein [Lachnospiraceae bacterium]